MPANLTLRRSKGAALTHNELDDNFVYLDGKIVTFDSAEISRLIDSGIDAQNFGDLLDSNMIKRFTLDSSETMGIFDSAIVVTVDSNYIINLVGTDFLDSAEAIALIDSTYVQARQIKYTTADFPDSAFVTGLNVSTFTNDVKYLDSDTVTGVINSTYINNNVTGAVITGTGIGGGVSTSPLTHPVGSYMPLKVRRSVTQTYNTGATYPGIFPGDTVSGSNLYYANGFSGYSAGYPAGIYNSVSVGTGTWMALAFLNDTHIQGSIRIGGVNYDASNGILYQRVA